MDRITKIVVPKELYDFYSRTAMQIRDYTPEKMMADALKLYADMITKPGCENSPEKCRNHPQAPSSSTSRSR